LHGEQFGEYVAEEMNSSEEKAAPPETKEAAKRWARLNGLFLAIVFLLGFVLPPEYRKFVPFLFVIPLIISVVYKVRQAVEKSRNPASNQTYSPPMPEQSYSTDRYSYTPKDPKDPRRYKPIG
jgi:hypothetical protein